jgi:acetyl-CoA acyltransferase
MSQLSPVYIVNAVRTPVGKFRGAFRHTRPDDLLAAVLKGLMAKTPTLDAALIDDIIIGCAMPEGEQGMNVARIAGLLAGIPLSVPAITINRFCSSGLQSIAFAADRIASGAAHAIIAGGVESMSMVTLGGNKLSANPAYFTDQAYEAIALNMGLTAENVASQWQISRQAQDEFALESHLRALKAIADGAFLKEILPISVTCQTPELTTGEIISTSRIVYQDEGPRSGSSLAALAKLPTVFKRQGTVTAGNSSQMSDGASALLLVSEAFLKEHQLQPMARFVGFEVAGVPPEIMGIGPKVAIPQVLKQTGLSLADIAWIELNEAFAAQALAVIEDLQLDRSRVNPYGGAIALGHPLGATGAVRTTMLLHGLIHSKQRYGMTTMCIGTGMGAAAIFENLQV